MSRFFVLLLATGALLVVGTPTADAQYRRYYPGLGGGGNYYAPRPMPQPRMVPRWYPRNPYYPSSGNRIPGQTAGRTPYICDRFGCRSY